jgi:hypothetical protein
MNIYAEYRLPSSVSTMTKFEQNFILVIRRAGGVTGKDENREKTAAHV